MITTINQLAAQVSTRYYIRAEYFYYAGTFFAPQDGVLTDEYGQRLEFASREDAVEHLETEIGCRKHSPGKYSSSSTYYLSHGEYSSPTYTIRKVPARRGK